MFDFFFNLFKKNIPIGLIIIGILYSLIIPPSENLFGISIIAIGVLWLVRKILRSRGYEQMSVIPTVVMSVGLFGSIGMIPEMGYGGDIGGVLTFIFLIAAGVVWIVIRFMRTSSKPGPQSNDDIISTYSRRGMAYSAKKEWDNAIADFSKAIEVLTGEITAAPDTARAKGNVYLATFYFERGLAYTQKRDNGRAIADFAAAVKLDPNNDDYREALNSAKNQ
jgi:tetratricopeptide (TPR) repeat protein